MTLTELKYITALAREKHFGHAAEACFVSQPTLSIAVKKLEDRLKVTLFERNKNSIQVTPVGERIVEQAAKVLSEASLLEDIAKAAGDPLSGPLRIGAIYTIGPYLLPHLIPQIKSLAPNMPLYVEENYTGVLRRKLAQGELDIILISLPFTEPDILTLSLYEEPFVVLMPHHHPLTKKKTVGAADLADNNVLMLGDGHCFREQILEALPPLRPDYPGAPDNSQPIEGSSLETLRHMVASDFGVTILPQTARRRRSLCRRSVGYPALCQPVAVTGGGLGLARQLPPSPGGGFDKGGGRQLSAH